MNPFPWSDVLVIAGLILLNGVFAMSELAIVSARPARLQLARIGGQRQRHLGPAAAAFGGQPQPRGPRRDNRQFGHGEQAVEQNQAGDYQHIGPGKRIHVSTVSRIVAPREVRLLVVTMRLAAMRLVDGLRSTSHLHRGR